ncbi:MAG: hypothetical protein COT74_09955 [Bdellovibrionales bacterium CG10_big_fil_rev_8_21_14_0_10_45_34]|nr:MAG: hypothetical protein COT74_09955 [Bdellovibrionales bacterium CG10_big_fil_rev_8_21_14_0_10_45_34]
MNPGELIIFRGDESKYPTPAFHYFSNLDLFVVCTPWGQHSEANYVIERTAEFFEKFQTDLELTSPVPIDTSYTSEENRIRNTLYQLNAETLERYNQKEFDWGCEILLAFECRHQVVIGRVGQINVFHFSAGNLVQPILGSSGFNRWNSSGERAPFPRQVLGMESSFASDITTFSKIPSSTVLFSQSPWYAHETFKPAIPDQAEETWRLNTSISQKPYWQVSLSF